MFAFRVPLHPSAFLVQHVCVRVLGILCIFYADSISLQLNNNKKKTK